MKAEPRLPSYSLAPRQRGEGQGEGPHFIPGLEIIGLAIAGSMLSEPGCARSGAGWNRARNVHVVLNAIAEAGRPAEAKGWRARRSGHEGSFASGPGLARGLLMHVSVARSNTEPKFSQRRTRDP
jgi:hypothetical protein